VPITAFGGVDDDEVSREDVEGWAAQTTRDFRLRMIPGGHFFLQTDRERLLAEVAAELRRDLARVLTTT
jgi:medium-chain acyl-[acyl-carrier-protein] hydrolase